MIRLIQFVLLLLSFQLLAQEKVQLQGLVFAYKPINEAHIYNKNSFKGTITNSKGEFEITVKRGDILIISAMPFEEKRLKVTKNVLKTHRVKIKLFESINTLDEVVVNSRHLTGHLLQDSKRVPKDKNGQYKIKINTKNINFESLADTGSGADRGRGDLINKQPMGGNILGLVGLIVDVIPKKQIRKKPKTFTKETPQWIRTELGDTFFIKELHISKPYIDAFLDEYCNTEAFINLFEENKIIECIALLIEKNKLKKYAFKPNDLD